MLAKLVLVACLVAAANAGAASFITKCRSEDSKCHKDSAQAALAVFTKGIPELGIEKLDPLYYEKLDASSKDLKLLLNDIYISGVKNCQIKKVQRDVANGKISLKAICTVNLDGQYDLNGRILFIPIQGKGKVTAVLKKVVINVEADIVDKVGSDGKKHWDIKTWRHSYELRDKCELKLDNLFEENKLLGDAARQLMDSNANEVITEVAPPILKAILTKIIKVIDQFFRKVAVEDLSMN